MATIIEAIYEHGVLRPLATEGLKEQHRYRLIVEESAAPEIRSDPALATEPNRRTTVLPDGRRIVRLGGLFERRMPPIPEDADLIAEALSDLRQERAAHLEAELDEFFPTDPGP